MSSNVAFLTCLVDITLRSPALFWMTTCLSELKSTIFQSLWNFGSSPWLWWFWTRTLSSILRGGSFVIFSLSSLLLFFAISTTWAFQSLCSSCMACVTLPCRITVFPGLSLFHSGLKSSLPKCSRNGEYPFMALGNVL